MNNVTRWGREGTSALCLAREVARRGLSSRNCLRCIDSVVDTTRRVACITHTNAAADEIDSRLRETCFGNEDKYYNIATIHGFALQNILRPFHHLLPELRRMATRFSPGSEAYLAKAKELLRAYDIKRIGPEEFERIQRAPDETLFRLETLPADLQIDWCTWLDENAYVTLNEIVYHSGRLVASHGHIASALASHFAWILVDEFQDSSPGQILILEEIHEFGRSTFFCVGDPNQSIYRFAGAPRPNFCWNSPITSMPIPNTVLLEISGRQPISANSPNASALPIRL